MLYTFNDIKSNDFSISSPYSIRLKPASYFIECWGAQGGTGSSNIQKYIGGKGAYASGVLNIKRTQTFYLHVGGRGEDGSTISGSRAKPGWNGGGEGGDDPSDDDGTGAGGGSTDIRYIENDLSSRIIVAAGGSGSVKGSYGAPGGAITGLIPTIYFEYKFTESNTTQDYGYSELEGAPGGSSGNVPTSGGGGGYKGGNAPSVSSCEVGSYHKCIASSGSSYISGHKQCSKNDHFVFLFPRMITGKDMMPHYTLNEVEGNGAIRITLLYPLCYTRRGIFLQINSFSYFLITLFYSIS